MKNTMKHLKKVFVMVALLATVMGYAKEPSFFIFNTKDSKTILTLHTVKQGDELTIKGVNGITLYKESIGKTGMYQKGFDLTSLPNGNYFFELNKDMEVRTVPFKVKTGDITFEKHLEKIVHKPYLWIKNNKLFLTKLSLNETPLDVKIYFVGDSSSELIYTEVLKNSKILERVYKLDDNEKGTYSVVITADDTVYQKTLDL